MLKFASAFSGGFGSPNFALKYEGIEFEDVFACEWKEPQRKSYLLNHGEPTSNFYKDIRDMDGTKYKGEIDYYHLSPPCQSYSLAGSRGGADDERGGLMFEAIKSIAQVQPKMFTIENVKGLLSSNGGEDWKNILRDVKSLNGYTITYGVINAKDQGTPQNRERLFIVGFRADCGQMPFPPPVPLETTLADLLEDEVDEKYYLSEKMLKGFILKEKRSDFKFNPLTKDSKTYGTLTARYYKMGITDPYIAELQQVGNIDQKGHNSLWGRVYKPQIAATQNANGGGAGAKTGLYLVGAEKGEKPILIIGCNEYRIRRLTPREGARVMGDFDNKFILDGFSDTKLYEFIGNAIDISTYRRLLVGILDFTKDTKWNEPNPIGFKGRAEQPQCTLF